MAPVSTLAVRAATAQDAAEIARVYAASWRTAYLGVLPQPFLEALGAEHRQRRWSDRLGVGHAGLVTVASFDEQVVGFCQAGPERRGGRRRGEIYALYVLSAYQGCGIGTALFEDMRARLVAQGCRVIGLWVLADNPLGQAFYEKMGGRRDGARTELYAGVRLPQYRYAWSL